MTKIDKFLTIPFLLIGLLGLIQAFIGLANFAVIVAAVAVAITIIAGLCWLNERTGGVVGVLCVLLSLS